MTMSNTGLARLPHLPRPIVEQIFAHLSPHRPSPFPRFPRPSQSLRHASSSSAAFGRSRNPIVPTSSSGSQQHGHLKAIQVSLRASKNAKSQSLVAELSPEEKVERTKQALINALVRLQEDGGGVERVIKRAQRLKTEGVLKDGLADWLFGETVWRFRFLPADARRLADSLFGSDTTSWPVKAWHAMSVSHSFQDDDLRGSIQLLAECKAALSPGRSSWTQEERDAISDMYLHVMALWTRLALVRPSVPTIPRRLATDLLELVGGADKISTLFLTAWMNAERIAGNYRAAIEVFGIINPSAATVLSPHLSRPLDLPSTDDPRAPTMESWQTLFRLPLPPTALRPLTHHLLAQVGKPDVELLNTLLSAVFKVRPSSIVDLPLILMLVRMFSLRHIQPTERSVDLIAAGMMKLARSSSSPLVQLLPGRRLERTGISERRKKLDDTFRTSDGLHVAEWDDLTDVVHGYLGAGQREKVYLPLRRPFGRMSSTPDELHPDHPQPDRTRPAVLTHLYTDRSEEELGPLPTDDRGRRAVILRAKRKSEEDRRKGLKEMLRAVEMLVQDGVKIVLRERISQSEGRESRTEVGDTELEEAFKALMASTREEVNPGQGRRASRLMRKVASERDAEQGAEGGAVVASQRIIAA